MYPHAFFLLLLLNTISVTIFVPAFFYRVLDISFNRIRKIENLEGLTNLKKLFLCANKISRIENVNHLKNLELLELGDNKIRVRM